MQKFDEPQINYIQNKCNERIGEILDFLGIDYIENNNYLQMSCPIHMGDNPKALYWAFRTNHWRCMTRHCEQNKITGKSTSSLGLIRGIMSSRQNKMWSFNDTIEFVIKLLNLNNIKIDKQTQQDTEINKIIKQFKNKKRTLNIRYPLLRDITNNLESDTIYYPSRGISKEIIDKYYISYCNTKGKPFYKRAFFPILDETGKYVAGWSARTIYNKCEKCKQYHKKDLYECPNIRKNYSKWKHSRGLKVEKCLYNYNYAKQHIIANKTAIICEGPGDVWSYEMANIKNSLAILGLNISKDQRKLLQNANALTLIFSLDNDRAGVEAQERIYEQLGCYFKIHFISPEKNKDIGDMSKDEIKEEIIPQLRRYGYG